MNKEKKGKYNFSFNVELFELLRSRQSEWQKVVEDPRAFFTDDREFEPMEIDNIKKEKKEERNEDF